MNEHDICRLRLKLIMPEVRQMFTAEEIKAAWAWGDGRGRNGSFEFHGPRDYYMTCSRACCLWSAKVDGWSAMLHPTEEGE